MKYKVKDRFRFSVFILVILLIITSIVLIGADASYENSNKERFVTVKQGETLWSIAEENFDYKKEDIREYIYNIKAINNLTETNVDIGQQIKLPY